MGSSFAASARLTIKSKSTFRKCAGCSVVSGLPGDETRCKPCRKAHNRRVA